MQDLNEGRVAQKSRTRVALLQSAAALLQQGKRPTVEEAAAAVGISKRTAYRYFVSQEHMLADAALESLRPEFATILDASRSSADPEQRLEALIASMNKLTPAYENEFRVIVQAALEPGRAQSKEGRSRGQRRLDWIEEALAPLKDELSEPLHDRLVAALSVIVGFDAYVVLRDIADLPATEIDRVMQWMGRALLQATLAEAKVGAGKD